MAKTITVGPVTRIEGHLDIEVTLDTVDGVQQVVDARVSGTMFRGFEIILKGKHPRDAIPLTQRICGVCPTSHGMAASMTLEAAYGPSAAPPPNGRILRNLIHGADFLQSHILHFYHLALLDYVDSPGVLGATSSAHRYTAPDVIPGPEAAGLLENYVKAMDIRRKTHQMGAIFGGKMPCTPVFVAGGCTQTLTDTLDLATAGEPTGSERIAQFRKLLDEARGFIDAAYLPDVRSLVRRFPAYSKIGRGCGNLLAFGAFDLDDTGSKRLLKRGVYTKGEDGPLDVGRITEHVTHSRYRDGVGALPPGEGVTEPEADKRGAYSWIKAPRYLDRPHEVGPLARAWIAGLYRRGPSVMDRLMARALETRHVAGAMAAWLGELTIDGPTSVRFRHPTSGAGIGLTEAPRGALAHWTQFEENAIRRYQVVTPTAWNGSPRDGLGQKGPIEQALIGTPVRDKEEPIELLRVVHSFDPCLACSVH
jgi:hydrogenase large subunit